MFTHAHSKGFYSGNRAILQLLWVSTWDYEPQSFLRIQVLAEGEGINVRLCRLDAFEWRRFDFRGMELPNKSSDYHLFHIEAHALQAGLRYERLLQVFRVQRRMDQT